MKKKNIQAMALVLVIFAASSCQDEFIGHIGASKLVIMQPVPMTEKKIDENFRAALELLYPVRCHDTVYIQDRVFLERIDLDVPSRLEFLIPPSLLRDFFGSNNPVKKQALREELLFLGDSSFENNPGRLFLAETPGGAGYSEIIGNYMNRNRKSSMVYLVSNDTLCKNYEIGGSLREVYTDFAKLNCRIVSDLRIKNAAELAGTTVILMLIPPEAKDYASMDTDHVVVAKPVGGKAGRIPACPPDSMINRINKQRNAIITEFRNLMHYIATTTDDDLERKYREDAYAEIHKIPGVLVDGIPGGDLAGFLNSGFPAKTGITAVIDHCGVISGIRIGKR